jgi:uncharacterized membrane protein YhaH (DUF805 family)
MPLYQSKTSYNQEYKSRSNLGYFIVMAICWFICFALFFIFINQESQTAKIILLIGLVVLLLLEAISILLLYNHSAKIKREFGSETLKNKSLYIQEDNKPIIPAPNPNEIAILEQEIRKTRMLKIIFGIFYLTMIIPWVTIMVINLIKNGGEYSGLYDIIPLLICSGIAIISAIVSYARQKRLQSRINALEQKLQNGTQSDFADAFVLSCKTRGSISAGWSKFSRITYTVYLAVSGISIPLKSLIYVDNKAAVPGISNTIQIGQVLGFASPVKKGETVRIVFDKNSPDCCLILEKF